ncbi:hypothetical protein DPX39_040085400 [Trypanosoma brucei equiperdum]|uniref:Uncharacterized protein n=1 Tax=Trypanosoma brucei equiperdum TaxID=630700 RepID=A0A3L6L8S4_9TRYP|nr:hypothetical protein DPX39_040085400 [Trypanosoma brucei equiperdum]
MSLGSLLTVHSASALPAPQSSQQAWPLSVSVDVPPQRQSRSVNNASPTFSPAFAFVLPQAFTRVVVPKLSCALVLAVPSKALLRSSLIADAGLFRTAVRAAS